MREYRIQYNVSTYLYIQNTRYYVVLENSIKWSFLNLANYLDSNIITTLTTNLVFHHTTPHYRSRRKSATRILKERGLGRMGIAMFGFRRKVQNNGTIVALAQSLLELVSTSARLAVFWTLKIAIFYPLVFLRRALKKLKPTPNDAKKNQAA